MGLCRGQFISGISLSCVDGESRGSLAGWLFFASSLSPRSDHVNVRIISFSVWWWLLLRLKLCCGRERQGQRPGNDIKIGDQGD